MKTFTVKGEGFGDLHNNTYSARKIKANDFREALNKFLNDEEIEPDLAESFMARVQDREYCDGGLIVEINNGKKNMSYIIKDGQLQEAKTIGELKLSLKLY